MNCDRCPHMKAIRKALSPCATCDCGRLHGQVSSDAAPSADLVYAHRRMSDHTPSTGVTSLQPDTEDALRKMLATIGQLDPIEQLLVHHAINGGGYADFDAVLERLLKRLRAKEPIIRGRKSGFRVFAHRIGCRIKAKAPALASILPCANGGE